MVSHREILDGERLLDVLTVESPDGAVHELYFDISECFRGRWPTPPCPYCGEPLRTAKARQCGRCLTDFHDPAQVIHRKGRAHVDQVRAMSDQRRVSEARPPGLKDPRAAFNALFRPSQVRRDVFVLRFPDRMHAANERLFQIGRECLIAEGCRGVVCSIPQTLRSVRRPLTSEEGEQVNLLLISIIEFLRLGVHVVLVGGDGTHERIARVDIPCELRIGRTCNCSTEFRVVGRPPTFSDTMRAARDAVVESPWHLSRPSLRRTTRETSSNCRVAFGVLGRVAARVGLEASPQVRVFESAQPRSQADYGQLACTWLTRARRG